MKAEQERVRALLSDTVTLLCRNGLNFDKDLRVEGVIGVTLDSKEVFIVHINDKINPAGDKLSLNGQEEDTREEATVESDSVSDSGSSSRGTKRTHSQEVSVKTEVQDDDDDDLLLVEEQSTMRVPPLHSEADMSGDMFGYNTPDGSMGGGFSPVKRMARPNMGGHRPSPSGPRGGGSRIHLPNLASNIAQSVTGANSPQASGSSWQPPGGPGASPQGAANSGMVPGVVSWQQNNNRRSSYGADKTCVCTLPGCNKRFYHMTHMYRHRKTCRYRDHNAQDHNNDDTLSLDSTVELREIIPEEYNHDSIKSEIEDTTD